MTVLLAPSILSADFSNLQKDIKMIEEAGADWVHIDVMDGCYVPNITIGPLVVKSIRKCTSMTFDVHLMIEKPETYVEDFIKAGADIITVHPGACKHLHRTLGLIKDLGSKAGISINPSTSLQGIEYYVDMLDLILIMTVNPGFGGQSFISSMVKKIEQASQLITDSGKKIHLQVDGGVNLETAKLVTQAGADVLVAGNYIFNSPSPKETIQKLKEL